MERSFKSSDERSIGYGPAYVIKDTEPDYLVGRLLTIVEAVGLPEQQEKSLKRLKDRKMGRTSQKGSFKKQPQEHLKQKPIKRVFIG